jgi:hypothetical protein
MKKLLIVLLLNCNSAYVKAQSIDSIKNQVVKTDSILKFDKEKFEFTLIDTSYKSKDELFSSSLSWIAINFKSAKDVIQLEDRASGRIIVKGFFSIEGASGLFGPSGTDNIHFQITIDIKDQKYRIVFNSFDHEGGPSGRYNGPSGGDLSMEKPSSGPLTISKARWKKIKDDTEIVSRKLFRNYRKTMRQTMPKDDF